MTSNRKVAANRRNSLKSTGPRTLSGKAIACMNALKHGLCARKPLIPGESDADFTRHSTDLVNHLQPADPEQCLLVEQIVMASWQLKRVPLLEAGLLTAFMKKDGNPFALPPEAYQQLARLDRHQACLQKTLDHAMKELRELQAVDSADYADEQNEATGAEVPTAVTVTPPQGKSPVALPPGRTA